MTLVSELELPAFDYTDASLRGERFHAAMAERARAGLAGAGAVRLHGARPRGRRVLPAHALGDLPGHEDRGDLRRHRGAAVRADEAQHPARQRRRPLASAQPRRTRRSRPRAVERYRPRDARVPGGADASDARRARRGADGEVRCDFVDAFAKPYPVAGDRVGDGRAAGGRAAAAPLVELDPEAVRRRAAWRARRTRSSRRSRSSTSTPRGSLRARRDGPARRPDVEADRRRRGGRAALRRRVHQPRLQHPRRRRRHDPEPDGARDPAARRTPRAVAAARRATRSSRAQRSRRRCATSRSRRSPRGSSPRRSSTAT